MGQPTASSQNDHFLSMRIVLSRLLIPTIIFAILFLIYCITYFNLNLFALAGLLLGVSCLVLAHAVLAYAKQKVHRLWALFNITVGVWGLATFFAGVENNYATAVIYWKIFVASLTYISIFFYHVVHVFCNLKNKNFLKFAYIQGILFVFFTITTNKIVDSLGYYYNEFLYLKATLGFTFLLFFWTTIAAAAFYHLHNFVKTHSGVRRIQANYLFYGMLLGFLGGLTTGPLSFGIQIYPVGHFFICIYAAILTYAIFKYQLMDIRIAVTRIGVFIAVYTLVLGIPFALAFGLQDMLIEKAGDNWWIIPLISSTVLATVGPFLYLYIQKKAEDKLLEDQHRYQSTLRQASYGMGRIKDLNRLLNLIVHIVTRTVGLEHSIVYVHDSVSKKFILGAHRSRKLRMRPPQNIERDSPIIKKLYNTKNPIVYEEIKLRTQDYGDRKLAQLEGALAEMDAAVIVPNFIDENLLAFIVLGKKLSGELYNNDDLTVFSILANQAALAIENAQFYEDMKKTHAQLIQAEKMATIGTMADGLSHQINNRLHALGFIAGDALDSLKLKKDFKMTKELKDLIIDLEYALSRIQDNVEQGGEIVRGLLQYTRKGEEGFTAVDLDKLIDAALEMTQFKIKEGHMDIVRDYAGDLPKINGNFTQLQEVFFNIIDNAYDAMMQRKQEMQEPGYKARIVITAATNNNGRIYITIEDNGIGIKDDDKEKLFTPFFTTKLSSKRGTGLGLYVIQKIIEENHGGKVNYDSEYQRGTKTKIRLQAAETEKSE